MASNKMMLLLLALLAFGVASGRPDNGRLRNGNLLTLLRDIETELGENLITFQVNLFMLIKVPY